MRKMSLHQRYMAEYEFRQILARYERECGECVTIQLTPEELAKEKQVTKKKYNPEAAIERIKNRK